MYTYIYMHRYRCEEDAVLLTPPNSCRPAEPQQESAGPEADATGSSQGA